MAQSYAGAQPRPPTPILSLHLTLPLTQYLAEKAAGWQLKCEHEKGEGSPQPPGMGGVAPLEERFEATPPLRGPFMELSWDSEMGKKQIM